MGRFARLQFAQLQKAAVSDFHSKKGLKKTDKRPQISWIPFFCYHKSHFKFYIFFENFEGNFRNEG